MKKGRQDAKASNVTSIDGILADPTITQRELEILMLVLEDAMDYGIMDKEGEVAVAPYEIQMLYAKLMVTEEIVDAKLAHENKSDEVAEESEYCG